MRRAHEKGEQPGDEAIRGAQGGAHVIADQLWMPDHRVFGYH